MTMVDLKGVHRVRAKLKDGTAVEYHYAWRGKGAPRFWASTDGCAAGSADYVAALAKAQPPKGQAARGLFREIILAFLASGEFSRLAPRTQADMRKSFYHAKNGVDHKFGSAPRATFNDPRIRGAALAWRDRIGGKVGDDRIRHLQRLVGFAVDRGLLATNRLMGIASIYHANRADMFWTAAEVDQFAAGAPPHIGRILIAATETGLRPGDLVQLVRQNIHPTPNGQRIIVFTKKRQKLASIPVTPRMAALIAETPEGQNHIITNKAGQPYQSENYLGDAVSTWRDKLHMRPLRLYDARGTAATRLLQAGADMKEIAVCMGWSLKHAAEVIDRYVALSPDMADQVGAKLAKAESGTKL